MTEEQLFALAWNRTGTLRQSLRDKVGDDPAFADANRALDELARIARHETPFGFFAHVLGGWRGRARILARLGPEANDALDEFLNLALDYEQRETPSLQGFLAWLRRAQSEVRRDMELARDEVRVMTVHGAKGLEANTVILADTTTEPKGSHPPKLLSLGGRRGGVGQAQAGRHRGGGGGARPHRRGGARRISPPALRRHDARGRTARRLRHARRPQDPRRLLVSARTRRARRRMLERAGRRRRRRGAALSQGRARDAARARNRNAGGGGRRAGVADARRAGRDSRRCAPSRRRAPRRRRAARRRRVRRRRCCAAR